MANRLSNSLQNLNFPRTAQTCRSSVPEVLNLSWTEHRIPEHNEKMQTTTVEELTAHGKYLQKHGSALGPLIRLPFWPGDLFTNDVLLEDILVRLVRSESAGQGTL